MFCESLGRNGKTASSSETTRISSENNGIGVSVSWIIK